MGINKETESIFTCPKCGQKLKRTRLYYSVLKFRNHMNTLVDNDEIFDLCENCNYFEYENKLK